MGRIIAFVNNKGGVGKTTSTINLGHALALKNNKVLVVDMDSQCNATGTFLDESPSEATLYEFLEGEENLTAEQCIRPTGIDRIFVLPNIRECATLETPLGNRPDMGFLILRDLLREHALANYDYTLIDCPPNLGLFAVQAIAAADAVIVPVEAGSRFALDGLEHTMSVIGSVQTHFNPALRHVRLLVGRLDKRTSIARITSLQIRRRFGDQVFGVDIPLYTAVQQAELLRTSVLDYAPESKAYHAFMGLAAEVSRVMA